MVGMMTLHCGTGRPANDSWDDSALYCLGYPARFFLSCSTLCCIWILAISSAFYRVSWLCCVNACTGFTG